MMNELLSKLEQARWHVLILVCLTWGLAPFAPPHFFQKLHMLAFGAAMAPIDWLDLFGHGAPWFLLLAKAALTLFRAPAGAS